MYRVFLGAPSMADLNKAPNASYHWETFTEEPAESQSKLEESQFDALLPPATLAAASRRISRSMRTLSFKMTSRSNRKRQNAVYSLPFVLETALTRSSDSTLLSWPATDPIGNSRHSILNMPSFLDPSANSLSAIYSDSSSIAHFPTFHFNLHSLTALASLEGQKGTRKVGMLLAALEVDGPDAIRLKKGPNAGTEIYVLKMILGDEDGHICKLTAWREIAEPHTSTALTASPYLHSRCQLCYRTMPYTPADMKLRPDLRLGYSDPSVRKVAALVEWFEDMAGLKH
ncbi:hypothetical protein BDZ89DRAFT_1095311 [Hymenopellis radicata]|nr:hypothetical protein BDZ89DRAFT_1095311 [Hymenopellis radicata]